MPIVRIDGLDDERVADYRDVPDPLRLRHQRAFVAEGRHVVRVLIAESHLRARSLLVTSGVLGWLESVVPSPAPWLGPALTAYIATPAQISGVVGFNVHRGCLAIGERPAAAGAERVVGADRERSLVIVLEDLTNADNVGGIFRNAAAFGVDAVVLSPRCCDPLYRKAIRVSMGASLRVPFGTLQPWPARLEWLQDAGYHLAALTPAADAIEITRFTGAARAPKLALLVGTEAEGLTSVVASAADSRIKISMAPGIDSLNVATATGIALHRLTAW